jgi:hypothetical protein
MAISNKPSVMVFYSGNGISIHDAEGKLRAVAKRGFGSQVRHRAAYARSRATPAPDAAQRVALAKRYAAEPGL